MNCPDCGAPMRLKADQAYLVCDYCGTTHVPDANPDGVRVLGEPSQEQCPRCSVALVNAAIADQRILYCSQCRGMLIDMDIFPVIVEELRSKQEVSQYAGRQPEWEDLDHHALCPHCRREMDTHPYGGPGNVIMDTCENCSVNWLDYGELQRIVHAPDPHYVITLDEDARDKLTLGKN